MRFPALLGLVWAAGCAWEPPLVLDSADVNGVIRGTVNIVGPDVPANVFLLLYDATNPGPPAGLGSPVNFTAIPSSAFETSPLGSWSAPFALTAIPGGTYLISALHDTDDDFHPFVDIRGGSTCGDWGGAHVGWLDEAGGPATTTLTLEDDDLLDGVPVVVQVQVPLERPAFVVLDESSAPARDSVSVTVDGSIVLSSTAVDVAKLDGGRFQLGPVQDPTNRQPCAVAFPFVPLLSTSETGETVLDGFEPPRVIFRELWADWPEDPPADFVPHVFQGIVDFDTRALSLQLLADTSRPPETTELSVKVSSDGLATLPFASAPSVPFSELPRGPYAVTVINAAGQTWTVPNVDGGLLAEDPQGAFQPEYQLATIVLE